MNSRKLVHLFVSTLLIGGILSIFVGFAVKWGEYIHLFKNAQIGDIVATAFWFLGIGLIFSLISQMGFFAYLTVHRFGLGIFKSASLWNAVQIVLMAFVLFDLVYLRYVSFAKTNESIIMYVIPALLILVYGILIAFVKMRETNKGAFVPALFFMTVVSVIEWFPALRANEKDWLLLMIIPLLVCNSWQLLKLHKLIGERS